MIWGSYRRPVIKFIFAILIFLSSLIVGVISIYQFSSVQTKTVKYLAGYFSKKIGMPVSIGHVSINWFREIELNDVKILDHKGEAMIAADQIIARFNPLTLYKDRSITFGMVSVDHADVRIIRQDSDGEFNIDEFAEAIRNLSKSDTSTARGSTKFRITNAELKNSFFTLSDPYKDSLTDQFNYNQFRLMDINAELNGLESFQGNFRINIRDLSCMDSATQFLIKKLSCNYLISDTSMVFQSMSLDAGKSHIETDYTFRFKDQDDLKSFNDKIKIIADINNASVYSRDLGLLAPYFKNENTYFKISGMFNGRISNFSFKNFRLQLGNITRLAGNLSMNGLPDINNTFIDLDVKNSIINPEDLADYIPEKSFETVKRFGHSSFIGRFTGFPRDFVADASFFTQIGEIESDINFKISQPDNSQYIGKLITKDFDLGKLVDNEKLLQLVDLNGYIKGSGLQLNDMDFNLNAEVSRLGINHYDFTGIKTDGRLTSSIFEGFISIDDPNLKFTANANVNLNKGSEKIKLLANLDTANLKSLQFTDQPAFISTRLDVDFNGLHLDDFNGYVNASNTKFIYNHNSLSLNKFRLNSVKTDSIREFTLNTDDMYINVSGKFNYTDVARDIPRILKEYEILFRNDSAEVAEYFDNLHKTDTTNYSLSYRVRIYNLNPFIHLFQPDYSIARNSIITGSIAEGNHSLIRLNTEIDTVIMKDYKFLNNSLNISASKLPGGRNVKLDLQFTSESQIPAEGPGFSDMMFTVNWENQNINTHFKINQTEKNNYIDLEGDVQLFPAYTRFKIIPVKFILLNEPWEISSSHYFIKKGKDLEIHDLLVYNEEQSVNIYGSISEDTAKSLNININNFKISNLNILLPKDLYGNINGYINLEGLYGTPFINSRLFIDSLVIENFYAGDIRISSLWNHDLSAFDMNLNVIKNKDEIIDVMGNYYPLRKKNQLDFNAKLNKASLNVLEPFYEDLVSDLRGKASGEFTISGNLSSPVLKGDANILNGNITLDYLKTTYSMDGNVEFRENEIRIRDLNLKDRYNNSGTISGSIRHKGFQDLSYRINGTFNNLNLLNTSVKDNPQYYGVAYGTGNIGITGQNNSLNIGINATSNSGTRLFIPLTGTEEAQQENFIQFARLDSTVNESEVQGNKKNTLRGIKLDFNLEVTPDAYCEIIFDPTTGEIIRGRGNGKLSLQIDTKGTFNMFGEYEITEGSYNFTLYNIINKAFTIQPGSTITWSGDPYSAQLDVTAEYKQLASLAPIFAPYVSHDSQPSFYQSSEVRRKYPSSVNLKLKGPLMSPEINFGIDIDYPQNLTVDNVSFSTIISAFENKIESNEQELKRQVFSLIVLRRFDEGSFSVSTSDVGSSVSEFISNQLSYWVSQLDENLQVNLDLGAISQKTANTFQLTLSYSLAQGRLRITRAGNFYADQTSNDVSNIIGDWTLEYMLTPDGNLRAKMYNRFNYNSITNTTYGNATNSTGFSLMQTQGFNKIRELFSGKNRKNKKNKREYEQYDEGIVPSDKTSLKGTTPPNE